MKYRAPEAGHYHVSLNTVLKKNQSVQFGKVERKLVRHIKPRWWEFWKNEVIEEELIPVDFKGIIEGRKVK